MSKNTSSQGRIPPQIKAWIKQNAGLVLGYIEALEEASEEVHDSAITDPHSFCGDNSRNSQSTAKNEVAVIDSNVDYNAERFTPQLLASNILNRPSHEPSLTLVPTQTKKRKHAEANFASDYDQNSNEWQAYTEAQQDHSATNNLDHDADIPKPFITPNLALAYSIDHSKTNPSNEIRLKTPYPAPPEILSASYQKYLANIALANAKAAAGASDSSNRIPFTIYEDDQIIRHMLAVSRDDSVPQTEERFAEVSRRLCGDGAGVYRSGTAIKNMWCRVGRGRSGFDERKGVRRSGMHVVNGWRAKPGNRKGTLMKKRKAAAEEVDDGWFEL